MNVWKKRILVAVLVGGVLIFADTMRSAEAQLTARVYVGFVHFYQDHGRPLLEGVVACRYRPTCSDYSIEAVEKHGIWRGIYMTVKRLASCTDDVPMGTVNLVEK